jgi:hypothetical protein
MSNSIKLILAIALTTFGCSEEQGTTIKNVLLQRWSISDSTHIDIFDFATIAQFDDYQYDNEGSFDSIKVILPIDGYRIELIREGNRIKNDLICIIPLPEKRIIRFRFSASGKALIYNGKSIEPEESKRIVMDRFKGTEKPNQQIISLVFEDSINQAFVCQSVKWINDGFVAFVTGGLPPDSTITEFNDLGQPVKANLENYRLFYGIGRVRDEDL